ncbi:hypothetical protein N4G70_29095 [Streptomyces sp. ASQP_92]|uniref:hypothetical protein n=1 Tax=Streptomyces sp. ASQP_92 TaxID=2979116 RepID=UPI0021C063BF|nr:hypothetical protein [Streptomyces sp. ASQP_92]MCT9092898.1 hypothetical protein [Streptomyces sp. ASQP_92]
MTDDHWGPTRRPKGKARDLTPEQQALAEDLHVRALALRAASDGELSIREAVDLAAFQLGLEAPQTGTVDGVGA